MGIPKILNNIKSHQKSIQRIFVLIYGIFGALVLYYAPVLFENSSTYFYVFSTISQSFVALVAFLGALVVFKMQLIENEIKETRRGIGVELNYYLNSQADTFNNDEIIESINKRVSTDAHYSILRASGDKMIKRTNEKREIRRSMVDFAIWNFIVVAIALILLPLSIFFVKGYLLYVGALFVLFNISISIKALHYGYFLVRLTMGYDFEISC